MTLVVKTVTDFIDKAATLYGQMQEERFNIEMWNNCVDMPIAGSPIEQLFWVAAHVLVESEFEKLNPEAIDGPNGPILPRGIYLDQQSQIGKYRVDFRLEQRGLAPDGVYTPVIVELDGHDFHDKDKRQRSYEKARDRFLVKSNFRVLHFTGSDVVADPFKVAYEALEMVGLFAGVREAYDKNDPLGMGR
jgi:very-short-patch-repair endonuclease